MADNWQTVREWPELILQRLEGGGVARMLLNRPERRNALNQALCEAALESLDIIRGDPEIKAVITKGNGPVFSSGLDLYYLRSTSEGPLRDWDRPTHTVELIQTIREFPRIMIAQVHGYVLGGAFGLMNVHDLVFAADNTQIGMPEILRGSFGQVATSTLYHSGIPIKKAAYVALIGRNLSGAECDRLGLVTQSFPEADLEEETLKIAREIGTRHLVPLQHAKIAAHFGMELPLPRAIQLDWLVGARQRLGIDPTEHVEEYLRSQKGGANVDYKRPDV